MSVTADRQRGVLHLRLGVDDALDAGCAEAIKREARGHVDDDLDIVVDLTGVGFIDSAGLGVLVSLFKAARRHGRRAAYVNAGEEVMRVMAIIKLDRILEVYDDMDQALRAFGVVESALPGR